MEERETWAADEARFEGFRPFGSDLDLAVTFRQENTPPGPFGLGRVKFSSI